MGAGLADYLHVPFTYCWSPSLVPKPKDWPSNIGKQIQILIGTTSELAIDQKMQTSVDFSFVIHQTLHLPKNSVNSCRLDLNQSTLDLEAL